jgi:membrane associated rhomboid family serine protease
MSWRRLFNNNNIEDPAKVLISLSIGGYVGWMINPSFMFSHTVNSEVNTIRQKKFYTIFTSAVSERDGFKVFFNCLTLYFFGTQVASMVGGTGLYTLYFAGAASNFAGNYYLANRYRSNLPSFNSQRASVAAVLAYFIMKRPWDTIYLVIFPVPAVLVGFLLLVTSRNSNEKDSELFGMGGAAAFRLLTLLKR